MTEEEPNLGDLAERVADLTAEAATAAEETAAFVAAESSSNINPEQLSEAMSEAFTYKDRDNSIPDLPFYDDFQLFWEPFAEKVFDILFNEEETNK